METTKQELVALLQETLNNDRTNQATKTTLSQYIETLAMGLGAPLNDYLCFQSGDHDQSLESTYQYYLNKGVDFDDCVRILKLLSRIVETHKKNTAYILTVFLDTTGEERTYCQSMNDVENVVFNTFTDWDREEDTIEDIDQHLRRNDVGYITVEPHTYISSRGLL